jgi:hypothetical protein
MEQPHPRIIRTKAYHDITVWIHEYGIASHGGSGKHFRIGRVVESCVVFASVDDLEGVAVKVEGVFPWVVVVEDDFDDFVVGKNELVSVRAVD